MKINNFVDKIFCINLKCRKNKKNFIKKQAKKYNLDITFFNAIQNIQNPANGCLQSHLQIIKLAKLRKYKKILIIEDDCQFLQEPTIDIKKLPKKWKQIYLGCNLQELLETESNIEKLKQKHFIKMKCLTTHSYILHNSAYNEIINNLTKCKNPIDVYYKNNFHNNGTSYVINPQIATQKEGFSDIEQKYLKYTLSDIDDFIKIKQSPHEYNEKTLDFKLKLKNFNDEDLPKVSILTPTKNRKNFFEMAIHCFKNYDYPEKKIEWIILDDSDDGTNLRDILPKDKRIKYIRIKTKRQIPISEKRNMCVKYASNDILINQDDDDYYFPHRIRTQVKVLLTYPKINMVGSGIVCCYDVNSEKFYNVGGPTTIAEATMCYRKKFFTERNFNKKVKMGEGILFLKERKHECFRIPHTFILFVMNHKNNVTNSLRKVTEEKDYINYYKLPSTILNIVNKQKN